MYEFLIESNPGLKGVIRKQLRAQYGVDPLSIEARRVPPLETSFPNPIP